MELATRGVIRQSFSTFPSGNDNELITKQELIDGTGGLLTVGPEWGANECIPTYVAYPVKAYICISATDKGSTTLVNIKRANKDNIYLSKPFSTLYVDEVKMGTINTVPHIDIPASVTEFAMAFLQLTNMGSYWAVKSTTPAMTYECKLIIDGVAVTLKVIVT